MRVHKGHNRGKASHNVSSIRWQMAAGNQKYDGAKEISICWMDSKSGNIRRSLRSRWSRYLCLPNSPQRTLPSSSSSAISWHQQFKSAIWISSSHQQWVGSSHQQTPKTSHEQWNDWMDLNNTKVVKSYTGKELSATMLPTHYLYQRSVDISISISSKLRLQPMHVQAAGVPPWQIVNMWERHTANELNQTNCTNPNTQGHTNTHQPTNSIITARIPTYQATTPNV